MLPPDLSLVLDRGEQAARLLEDETFRAVVDDLVQGHLAALCAAPPGQRGADARDYHAAAQWALAQIVSDLQGRVEVADKVRAQFDHNQDEYE